MPINPRGHQIMLIQLFLTNGSQGSQQKQAHVFGLQENHAWQELCERLGLVSNLVHQLRLDEGSRVSVNDIQSVMRIEIVSSLRYGGREDVEIKLVLSFTPHPDLLKWEISFWNCNSCTYHLKTNRDKALNDWAYCTCFSDITMFLVAEYLLFNDNSWKNKQTNNKTPHPFNCNHIPRVFLPTRFLNC